MECNCGVEIEVWREQCADCEIQDVMGAGPDRRLAPNGCAMRATGCLRTKRPNALGHDMRFYVLRWRKRGLVKIGATSNLPQRMQELQRQAGEPLELVTEGHLADYGAETAFHAMMNGSAEKFSGEWYYWSPRIESLIERLKMAPARA